MGVEAYDLGRDNKGLSPNLIAWIRDYRWAKIHTG